MTVEELMEVLSRCDKHKPVVLVTSSAEATVNDDEDEENIEHQFNIDFAQAHSMASVASPVKLFIGTIFSPTK